MLKILILEDDIPLVKAYEKKFTDEGCEVKVAQDGKEGLALLQTFTPDIIILDLIMPTMTGFDFLKAIKEDQKLNTIPVLILTNIYADTLDLIKNYGVAGVMLKANSTLEEIYQRILTITSANAQFR